MPTHPDITTDDAKRYLRHLANLALLVAGHLELHDNDPTFFHSGQARTALNELLTYSKRLAALRRPILHSVNDPTTTRARIRRAMHDGTVPDYLTTFAAVRDYLSETMRPFSHDDFLAVWRETHPKGSHKRRPVPKMFLE